MLPKKAARLRHRAACQWRSDAIVVGTAVAIASFGQGGYPSRFSDHVTDVSGGEIDNIYHDIPPATDMSSSWVSSRISAFFALCISVSNVFQGSGESAAMDTLAQPDFARCDHDHELRGRSGTTRASGILNGTPQKLLGYLHSLNVDRACVA
jgi:hypothetical protein